MFSWFKKSNINSDQAQRAPEATTSDLSEIPFHLTEESSAYKNSGDKYYDEGKLEEAAKQYKKALSIDPNFAEAHNNLGNVYSEQKHYNEAERCLKQAIRIKPELANAHYNLGALLLEKNRPDEAVDYLNKALQLKPDAEAIYRDLGYALFRADRYAEAKKVMHMGIKFKHNTADFHAFLGNLHLHDNEIDQAVVCYQNALSIQPDIPAININLGRIFHKQGKFQDAIDCYQKAQVMESDNADLYYEIGILQRKLLNPEEAKIAFLKVLEHKPDFVEAYIYLGIVINDLGQPEEALMYYQKSLSINPDLVEVYVNKGNILKEQGKTEEAIACYQKALTLKPETAEALLNLGLIFKSRGELNQSASLYREAIKLNPNMADAYNNLGNVLFEQYLLDDALECYRKAIEIKPEFADAYYSTGAVCIMQRKNIESITYLKKALQIEPEHNTSKTLMLHQLQHMCEWDNLKLLTQEVRLAILNAPKNDKNLFPPFAFLAIPGTTAKEQQYCAERWAQTEYKSLTSLRRTINFKVKRVPNKKIAIGYISADLRNHPVAFLMAEVFELHDRSSFNVIAYAYDKDESSEMRTRLESAFDSFVDITALTYEQAARKIFHDQIDILVDLTGHTQNNRSGILALRPAPIQVSYLGYPGTMGADFYNYLLADRFTIPPDKTQYYTEKVAWIPDCFQANDRHRPLPKPPTRAECGLPNDALIFCCFNQTLKITPDIFDIWCRLLYVIPQSILWVSASNPQAEDNLRREAEKRGISAERLIMAPLLHREAHLARMQCADLFLDTLPYNAGTTCSDALWMGLPVITCVGDSFVSRMAGSLLAAIEVPELITYSLDNYYLLAHELATNKQKRESIRNKIIYNRNATALFDSVKFTKNLEQVYLEMFADLQETH